MQLRLTIKIPSLANLSGVVSRKMRRAVERAVKNATPKVQALIIDRVGAEADRQLHSMAAPYRASLAAPGAITVEPNRVTVKLSGIAKALEEGTESFDLKQRLLAKAKKSGKKGPYIDVAFQHQAQNIPSRLRALAKSGGTGTVRVVQKTPGRSFKRTLTIDGTKISTRVQHARGIHDDLIRHASNRGQRSRYVTIRRISASSSATSWWHPGFKPLGLLKKTAPKIKADIAAILRDSLHAAGALTK